jgi:hypothetical protein
MKTFYMSKRILILSVLNLFVLVSYTFAFEKNEVCRDIWLSGDIDAFFTYDDYFDFRDAIKASDDY